MGFIDLGVNRIITIHSSYLIVFLKLVFQMKCMLHEINHGVVFPFCPVAPEKPPSLAVATPACSGSVVCSFWTFQGSGLLQRGLPRERKSPPGGGEDGFWARCPHMDKTHSPDSVDRGQGPGKQLRVPLGPQLPSGWASGVHVQDAGWFRRPLVTYPAAGFSCGGLWLHLRCP